ncbi:MAG: EpsI family protein, partial [Rhodocyclales bacterium CG17_big_fil_post_rev_8_21_14_2_50_68_7]
MERVRPGHVTPRDRGLAAAKAVWLAYPGGEIMRSYNAFIAILMLSVGIWASRSLRRVQSIEPSTRMDVHLRDFPHKLGTWRNKKSVEMDPDVIAVLGLDDWLVRHYEDGSGRGVQLYIGYLDSWSGKKRRKTVHSPQFCYAGAGWEILEKGVISLPVLERSTLPITR